MPSSAHHPCTKPGCTTLVKAGRCSVHARERAFVRDPNVKRLYNSKRWQRIRANQLAQYPYCVVCMREGHEIKATEVDHVRPHRGDERLFFAGPFQSMCKAHHSSKTQAEVFMGHSPY